MGIIGKAERKTNFNIMEMSFYAKIESSLHIQVENHIIIGDEIFRSLKKEGFI